jgi:hypothetical protein
VRAAIGRGLVPLDTTGGKSVIATYDFTVRSTDWTGHVVEQVHTLSIIDTVLNVATLLSNDMEINVFPNPTTSSLSVGHGKIHVQAIGITNMKGQCILSKSMSSSDELIDVSSLSAGVYVLHINTGKGIIVKKFLKK